MEVPFPVLARLLQDPPPEFVFEVAPDCIRMARTADPAHIQTQPLPAGVVSPSPLHDNIGLPELLDEAVKKLVPPARSKKRRTAALLLPDHSAHISVVEFVGLPENHEERAALIRARVRRSVPFDVDGAAMSYWVQSGTGSSSVKTGSKPKRDVVVVVTPPEIVQRYESSFISAGIHPGLVSLAPLACLDLVDVHGIALVGRLSGSVLTILVKDVQTLKLARSIELENPPTDAASLEEIAGHLHQTLVYVEDNLGGPALELLLAGFGTLQAEAAREYPAAFQVPVRVLGGADTAIRGYLRTSGRSSASGAAA
jgi:type IV pilus assembly protein PilM